MDSSKKKTFKKELFTFDVADDTWLGGGELQSIKLSSFFGGSKLTFVTAEN